MYVCVNTIYCSLKLYFLKFLIENDFANALKKAFAKTFAMEKNAAEKSEKKGAAILQRMRNTSKNM